MTVSLLSTLEAVSISELGFVAVDKTHWWSSEEGVDSTAQACGQDEVYGAFLRPP